MKLSQCNDLCPGNLNLDKIVSVWFFLRSFLWSGFTKLLQKWMLKPCDAYRGIVFHTVIWVFYSFIYLFLMLLLLLWWLLLSGIIRFIVCLMIFFLFNNFFPQRSGIQGGIYPWPVCRTTIVSYVFSWKDNIRLVAS